MWEEVLGWTAVEGIYSGHSSEKEKLHSCAIHFTSKPNTSWEELVKVLYYDRGEMAAAKEAKAFLQQKGRWLILIFTLGACMRGKVIGSVIIIVVVVFHTKIARSDNVGMLMSGQSCEYIKSGENVTSLWSLDKDHECYKSCFSISHAYRPHLVMPYAVSIAHAQAQYG